jgi:integrase/recombinase XerD
MGITTVDRGERTDSEVVQWFLDYYWIRHPVSRETVAAYRADLLDLAQWLRVSRKKTLVAASDKDVREFFESRYRAGGRLMRDVPSLSCIKRFYFYLVEVGLRAEDPTEHLYVRTPRLIRQDVMVLLGEKA